MRYFGLERPDADKKTTRVLDRQWWGRAYVMDMTLSSFFLWTTCRIAYVTVEACELLLHGY